MKNECSWCWQQLHEVAHLIEGPNNIAICDECIELMNEMLQKKRAPTREEELRALLAHEQKKP
jgi:ATP-dependent protease Clp ATPase subunit